MSVIHQPEEIIQGKYRITGILGKGGVAITYSAIALESNSPVAIKVISLRQLNDWKQVELFQREAEVLKQLSHPNIPDYIDYFDLETETDKTFYLVQQLAPGKSLYQLVESGWRSNEEEIENIAQQILKVLTYLHSLDPPVIHRDIKPHNLIRSDEGKIYLVDFGAVQNTYYNTLMQGSTVVGTYGYMAPEQFRGQALPATDLYSLGATLLYLLTHRSPAELPQDTLKLDFRSAVNISESFAAWLETILEPDLEDRFSNANLALLKLAKSNHRKQRKLITSFASIALVVSLIIGLNSQKWFFLSKLGYAPSNICSSQVLPKFIKQGGNLKDINTDEKASALLCMIKGKTEETEIIEKLLRDNNNIHQTIDRSTPVEINRQPLHLSLLYHKYETAKLLIDYDADINAKDISDRTPLHYLVRNINTYKVSRGFYQEKTKQQAFKMLQLLLDSNIDINARDKYNQSVINLAIGNELEDVVKILIENGIDLNVRDINGRSPLYYAATKGKINIVKLLIDNGADVNVQSSFAENYLHKVAAYGHWEIAKMLIDSGANINAQDKYGKTALFYVKDKEMAQLLIENGADVNATDYNGKTPLFYAHNNKDVEKLLIDQGAKVIVEDNYGCTPLIRAIYRSYFESVKLLIEQGAIVNMPPGKCDNPIIAAIIEQNKDIVQLLINHGADAKYLEYESLESFLTNKRPKKLLEIEAFLDDNEFDINKE